MKAIDLAITLGPDDRHPMHEFIVCHDGFERSRMLQVNYSDQESAGFGIQTALFHIVGSPRDAYEAALADTEAVLEYDLSDRGDDSFYVYVRGEHTEEDDQLVRALRRAGLVGRMPITFHDDGRMTLTVIGPGDTVQAALDALPPGLDVAVDSIREYDARQFSPGGGLTDRQREAVEAAVTCGYYEDPRAGSVAEVGEAMGCAPGTAAEHLRRAEARVMRSIAGDG
jgi:hypothetical protein